MSFWLECNQPQKKVQEASSESVESCNMHVDLTELFFEKNEIFSWRTTGSLFFSQLAHSVTTRAIHSPSKQSSKMNRHHGTQQHRSDDHLGEILKSLIDRNHRAQTNSSHRVAPNTTDAQFPQANGGGAASLLCTQPVIFQNSSSYPSPFMGISPSYSYPQYSISPSEQAAVTLLMNEQLLKKRQLQAAVAEAAQRALLATSPPLSVLPSSHPGYAGLPIESLIQSSLSQAFQEGLRAANERNATSTENDVRSSVSLMASPTGGPMGSLDKKKEPPLDNKIIPEEHLIRLRFPEKLFYMLKQEEHDSSHIISFVGNGSAIKIHDPRLFETDILPRYFDGTRITSFQRQLNLYGFRRIDMGPCRGAYFHKYFVQGQEDNLFKIVRDYKGRTSGGGASASSAAKKEKLPISSSTTKGGGISSSTCLDAEGKVPSTNKSPPVAKRSSPLELLKISEEV